MKYSYKKAKNKAIKKTKKVLNNLDLGDPFDDDRCENEVQLKKDIIKYIVQSM